jgi:gamma-aminobutyric acid type B receptor
MIFGTNLSFFLRIPLVLPDLTVDMNFLGSLRILGYTLFGIIVVADIVSTIWVVRNWNTRIVSAGQPFFLVTIALGVLIMSASTVPMGFDDENWENLDQACMAEPWLLTVGFGIIFAGLFSKLWRVDRLISSAMRFSKKLVSIRDVMLPFCVLTLINVTILICWTIFAPLHYVRQDYEGTDPWNRVISTHGSCRSAEDNNSYPFVGSLGLINFGALMLANFAAFRTRHVETELSESRYIAITVAFMTQAALVGLPVLLLVDDEPQAHYVVQVMLVFCVCIAILGFIFVPKIVHLHGLGRSPSSNVRASLKAERCTSSSKNKRSQSFVSSIRQYGVLNDTVAHIRAAAQASMRVSITDLPVKSAEGTETSPDTEDAGTEIFERASKPHDSDVEEAL